MQNNESEASILLDEHKIGALLRIFARQPDEVEAQIDSAIIALQKLRALSIGNKKIISQIDFLIPSDTRYRDSDCGRTAARLREKIAAVCNDSSVRVHKVQRGDIYVTSLNYGVAMQLQDGISYSLILSHYVHPHITNTNLIALLATMRNQALVAGLALPEIAHTVRLGRVANTFALWHNISLMTVGGFDVRAAQHRTADFTPTISATLSSTTTEPLTYQLAGAEEIIPLLRLVTTYGPCIKVIEPDLPASTNSIPFTDSWQQRHQAKLATKDVRQRYMASLVDLPIETLTDNML